MKLSESSGALKRFRRTPSRFQITFETPLKDLRNFTDIIFSTNDAIQSGCLIIDKVIMQPKDLIALLSKYSLPREYGHDKSVEANGAQEVRELLEAALGCWLDFIFVPSPKPFMIYADHDEYITFYANTKSNLNSVAQALSIQGYKKVEGYERSL